MEVRHYRALEETMQHTVLENGLHIYVDSKPEYAKQFAFFATKYGGMNMRFREVGGEWRNTPAGVAHFLEHKMFDTEEGDASQKMAENGADPNAFTSFDITGYFFESTENFSENLRILLSFVSVPWFTAESVDKEQGIIGQEIRMGEDNPHSEVFYNMLRGLYANHPIRVNVAGTVESIAQITADTLYMCHKAFYNPANMVLCVAGSVDPEEVAAIAREVLPQVETLTVETDFGEPEKPVAYRSLTEQEMEVSAPLFEIGFKGVPAEDGARLRQILVGNLAADVLFSASSPLYSSLYEAGLINNSFEGGYEDAPRCAYLCVGGESENPERVRDLLLEEAARIAQEGIEDALWERQKKASYGASVRKLNSMENICIEAAEAHFLGEDFMNFPELYRSIEKQDAEKMIAQWCVPERTTLSIIRPKGEKK